MTSQKLSTKMQKTVQSMKKAVCRLRGTKDGVHRAGCGASGPRRQHRLEEERLSGAGRSLLVAEGDDEGSGYKGDQFVTKNPIWTDAGRAFQKEGIAVFRGVTERVCLDGRKAFIR